MRPVVLCFILVIQLAAVVSQGTLQHIFPDVMLSQRQSPGCSSAGEITVEERGKIYFYSATSKPNNSAQFCCCVLYTMPCRYNAVNFLQILRNRHPNSSHTSARHGVSSVTLIPELCSAPITAVLCANLDKNAVMRLELYKKKGELIPKETYLASFYSRSLTCWWYNCK